MEIFIKVIYFVMEKNKKKKIKTQNMHFTLKKKKKNILF